MAYRNMDGDSVSCHYLRDISIAVSAPKELSVPVIRNAESLHMPEIERKIVELATKAEKTSVVSKKCRVEHLQSRKGDISFFI
jgi:2-oxoglutarate dehydrogenase E2 component (dihydrolipoamide succinyltransferase)